MDFISIRCKSCMHKMQFPGDKAGKKTQCPKCGTPTVIQLEAEAADDSGEIKLVDIADSSIQVPSAPAPTTTKPDDEEFSVKLVDDSGPPVVHAIDVKKTAFDDDEANSQYGVFVDPELAERQRLLREEEEAKAKKRKEKKKLPKVTRKVKAIDDAEGWEKVRVGLLVMLVGVCIWAFMHLLQGIYVIIGVVELPEYAVLIATNLERRGANDSSHNITTGPIGEGWPRDPAELNPKARELIAGWGWQAIPDPNGVGRYKFSLPDDGTLRRYQWRANLVQLYDAITEDDRLPPANMFLLFQMFEGNEDFPPAGQTWDVSEFDIYMTMIAGMGFAGFAKFCLITATLCYFLMAAAFGVGYVIISMHVPRHASMHVQVFIMMGLLAFNFLIVFIFKLLPMLGVFNYIMIPLVVPEIAMTEYNMERSIPINVLWSGAPFTENFFCIVFKFLFYLEPTFAGILLWTIGTIVKSDDLAEGGKGLTQISLGAFFVLLAFHLLSVCGATPVMVGVLRVLYVLWYCFFLMFILQYAMLILKCRTVLEEKIHPKNELTE